MTLEERLAQLVAQRQQVQQAYERANGDWQQELFLELNALDMRIAALKKAQNEEVNYRAGYKTSKDPEARGRGTEGH